MSRKTVPILIALTSTLLGACTGNVDWSPPTSLPEEAVSLPPTIPIEASATPPSEDVVAFSTTGALVVIDAATGALAARAEPLEGSRAQDVVFNPWSRKLVVYHAYDDEWGSVLSYPVLQDNSLGSAESLGDVGGDARLLPTPFATLLFNRDYDESWNLLGMTAPANNVVAQPSPLAAYLDDEDRVHGLTCVDDEGLSLRSVSVDASGFGEVTTSLLGRPCTSAWLADDNLFEVEEGKLVAHTLGDVTVRGRQTFGIETSTIVAGASAPGLYVLLVTEPPRALLFTSTDGQITLTSSVPLPDVVGDTKLFSRNVVIARQRVLAATLKGVMAFDIASEGGLPTLIADNQFEGKHLRGPLEHL